jgi:hypothetical protein
MIIIGQQKATTVFGQQEAMSPSVSRKQCHQTAVRNVITTQSKNGDCKDVSIHGNAVNTHSQADYVHIKATSPSMNRAQAE